MDVTRARPGERGHRAATPPGPGRRRSFEARAHGRNAPRAAPPCGRAWRGGRKWGRQGGPPACRLNISPLPAALYTPPARYIDCRHAGPQIVRWLANQPQGRFGRRSLPSSSLGAGTQRPRRHAERPARHPRPANRQVRSAPGPTGGDKPPEVSEVKAACPRPAGGYGGAEPRAAGVCGCHTRARPGERGHTAATPPGRRRSFEARAHGRNAPRAAQIIATPSKAA